MTLRSTILAAAASFAAATMPLSAQEAEAGPQERTTLEGVFSAEQAAQGREVYIGVCSECHALDEYQGDTMVGWQGAQLYELYDLIRTKMPEDNPGSLSNRQYVATVAFILELNGMPPGEENLSSRRSVLESILFKLKDES